MQVLSEITDSPPELFSIVPMPADVDELPPPTKGPYYVLARNGLYVHKFSHHGRTLTPVNQIAHLNTLDNSEDAFFWYNEENLRLPAELVGKVWSFFRSVFNQRHSEAMVNITYHPRQGYRVFVPPQRASGGGVDAKFDATHLQPGWRVVGTIHSHCDFDAFHSGVDTHDADDHDGLHLTIGHVDKNPPQIASMVSASGKRWNFELEHVLDGPLKLVPHPKWWERYVEDPGPHNKGHVTTWNGRSKGIPSSSLVPSQYSGYQRSWMDDEDYAPKAQAPGSSGAGTARHPAPRGGFYDLDFLIADAEHNAGDREIAHWTQAVSGLGQDLEQIIGGLEELGIATNYDFELTDRPPFDEEPAK